MDKNTLLRWVIIAASMLLFWKFGMPLITGKTEGSTQPVPAETYVNAPEFAPDILDPRPANADPNAPYVPPEGDICKIKGSHFNAELSTRGAAITHFYLTDSQYAGTEAGDMSTTPDHERWRTLRTLFRDSNAPVGTDEQVKYDRFNWKLDPPPAERGNGAGCQFTYQDATSKIVKSVTPGSRPFELNVETTLTNLADAPKKHRFSIESFAFRRNSEVKGHLGRVSPFITELSCARDKDVNRKSKDDFKDGWFNEPLVDRYAAVSNYYFAQALIPEGSDKPECGLLAEDWYGAGQKRDDDDAGSVYHARLTYPAKELAPKGSETYKQTAFIGPKERSILAHAGGGRGLGDLINLGFFSIVAKGLVSVLLFFHDHVTFGNWGLAIIAMTLCLRMALFPLTWKSIKTTIEMRRLKPEVDALNAKFADDAQAKNLAMMELWKKHGVNPFGGCLPQLIQMPIWFAMYTTLQTAVEMYHEKFLWFTDLSAPDKLYILPLVLGVFMIIQQRIVPQQGMDPVQAKMMMYVMPGIFTVMMLFLPAALGVYMLTNSVLGITQQLAVEKFAPSKPKKGEIIVKQIGDAGGLPKDPPAFGKGKARV